MGSILTNIIKPSFDPSNHRRPSAQALPGCGPSQRFSRGYGIRCNESIPRLYASFLLWVFDIDGADRVGILLENSHGLTLAEYPANSIMEEDQVRNLYLDCMYALRCMHDIGYAHRDIRAKTLSLPKLAKL